MDFAEPMRVARLMEGFQRPWFVCGGWAVDLFLGKVTRPHKDIEIGIFREDQAALRHHLAGWEFRKAIPKTQGRLEDWEEDEWLTLPVHELRAIKGEFEVEVLLNEASIDAWIFRRNPQVVRPRALSVMSSSAGLPILAPEIVLLYKAADPKLRDARDFANASGQLSAGPRVWLKSALLHCYPGHPWLEGL